MEIVAVVLAVALAAVSAILWRTARRARDLAAANDELQREVAALKKSQQENATVLAQLQRESDLMKALMDNIPDQIYFKDLDSNFLKVNQGVADTLGVKTPAEALGKTDSDFFPGPDAAAFRSDDQSVMASARQLRDRTEVGHTKAGEVWMSTTKAPVFDAAGKVIGLVGISRDITERRRAEQALTHERDLLRALMDNMPDQIYFKDAAGRFMRVNHAVLRNLGAQSAAEVIGKTDFDFMPAERAQAHRADEETILATGKPIIGRVLTRVRDGSQRWVSTTKVPLLDRSGNVVGIVGINRDVTEHMRAESNLRDVISRAQCVLWHAEVTEKDGVLVWNMHLFTSEPIRRWLGLDQSGSTASEVWGKRIAPEDLPEMNRRALEALRSGQAGYTQEFRMHGVDGSERWMAENVGVTPIGPGTWSLVGVVLDITERRRVEQALRQSEFLLRQVLDTNPNIIRLRDARGKIILANAAFAEFYRISPEKIAGMMHTDLHVAHGGQQEEIAQWLKEDAEVVRSGQSITKEDPVLVPGDGSERWHRTRKLPLALAGGAPAVLVISEDITILKRAQEQLAKERDLLQALMDNVPDNVYFKDRQSRFIRTNRYHALYLGMSHPDQIVGKTDFDLYPAERAREFYQDERDVIAGKRIIGKVERQFIEGAPERWTLTSKVPFYDRDGNIIGLVGVSQDVTALKKMEQQLADVNEQLNKLAREDALTGLLNRRMILELAENEWGRWRRFNNIFSLMIVDADNFKAINDTFGHQSGDQALRYIANRLCESVRSVDIVGRYGGEEFVVILPSTGQEGAVFAAEKILHNIRKSPLHINGQPLTITVSIGVSTVRHEDKNIDMLLQRADTALYAAKRAGKDRLATSATTSSRVLPIITEQE
ncbi:MAG TPA: PAS domain-containing protein [Planctomycetota bacterium]|jgi:diguanylate cyclase (GGDEF)-like protein/PAS domain S-box-containing protein